MKPEDEVAELFRNRLTLLVPLSEGMQPTARGLQPIEEEPTDGDVQG